MQRKLINSLGRDQLWAAWSIFIGTSPVLDGDRQRNLAQALDALLKHEGVFEGVDYDDREYEWLAIRAEGPKYIGEAPRSLVLCPDGVTWLHEFVKRLYREETIPPTDREVIANHLYYIHEGTIGYESFAVQDGEFELVKRPDPAAPFIHRHDSPAWRPYFAALKRGERCEIDEKFYDYFLGVLPPIFMSRTVELVDGTQRYANFGMAEGQRVTITAYWSEREGDVTRYFSQRTKLRTGY